MKQFLIPVAALSLALLPGLTPAEDAVSIFNSFEAEKAEALEDYLESNPDAEDAGTARSMLIAAYTQLGESKKAVPILEARYESLSKGPDANLEELIPGVIEPLFRAHVAAGDKDAAAASLARAKEDLKAHPRAAGIMQFFDSLTAQLAAPSVGDAMEIAFTSLRGEEVDLAEMKDKVVLVDFWATWCGPCIAEMPNVIATYEKYKDAGFEVIAISLDEDRAALEQFIADHNMPWPQAFDGKGWEGDFVKQFGITGIPATFLIGKDGNIAASNLRGEQLESTVAKLLQ